MRVSSLNNLGLNNPRIATQTGRYKNHNITQHRLTPRPHPRITTKIASPRLQHNQLVSVRQNVRSDPPTEVFHEYQQQLMEYPSVVWQQQMEKATIITFNNTHLYQTPITVWDPDQITCFTTEFRRTPLIDDYNPTKIDPD